MKRVALSEQFQILLKSAARIAAAVEAQGVVLLAEKPFDFCEVRSALKKVRLLVAADKPDVQQAVNQDEVDLIPILHEPQTRQHQLSQALLEAIADDLLQSGDTILALFSTYANDEVDSLTIVNLAEQLAALTSRDLRRLETQVPLETLRMVVDLAVEIGREGREGKPVGTLFVVGSHRKVLQQSHEQIHDPFRGYSKSERMIRNPRVRESMKEIAQIDGAFIVGSDGTVHAAGRILNAPEGGLTMSKGLGSRHWAAAAISKATGAVAIAVSESTGTVRIFQNGVVVLRIEPMVRPMKWDGFDTEPPPVDS